MHGRIAYVNGRYLPRLEAAVSIEDRGYQFADGIYEVIWVRGGVLVDMAAHLARLRRSLEALTIAAPEEAVLLHIIQELLRQNRARQGHYALYIQITRGVARRNHLFPPHTKPSLVMTLTPITPPTQEEVEKGIKIITHTDQRWARRDIKSIALLPNILARQTAFEKGGREALLVDEARDIVTEGSTANIFIVKNKVLITHPADYSILNGITRMAILALARTLRITIQERAFTPKEAQTADELFITSTTAGLLPVSMLNDVPKKVGPLSLKLYTAYQEYVSAQC